MIQIMTEPEEISLLNVDKNSYIDLEWKSMPSDSLTHYRFDMSQTIKIEHRKVLSIPSLFGELGGLYEFLATIIVTLIGGIQSKFFAFDKVESLFKAPKYSRGQELLKLRA